VSANFVQQVEASQVTGVPTIDAPAFTATIGNLLIALVGYDKAASTSVALSDTTGSNGTWTTGPSGEVANGVFRYTAFYLANCASGLSTIRATFGATPDIIPSVYVAEFSGVAAGAAIGNAANAQAAPGTGTDAITTGNSGTLGSQPALVFGFTAANGSTPSIASGTGYTGLTGVWDYGLGGGPFAKPEWQRVLSTVALAATFTDASQGLADSYVSFLLAFAEAAAGLTAIGSSGGFGGGVGASAVGSGA